MFSEKKHQKLLKKSMLKNMRPGSVMVDISIDQGGCFETSRPTTHSEPVFIENEIVALLCNEYAWGSSINCYSSSK